MTSRFRSTVAGRGLAEALRAVRLMLRTQRLRAAVIVLCTAAGVTFLVGIVAAVHAVGNQLEHDILGKLYGFNTVQLHPPGNTSEDQHETVGASLRDRHRGLTIADAEWLEGHLPMDGVISYSYGGSARVRPLGTRSSDDLTAQVLAASGTQFAVQSLEVNAGRPFTDYEARAGAGVAVLGADVARRLFDNRPGVGQLVLVAGLPFRVIGVLQRRGRFLGFSMDNLVVVPARSRLNGVINQRDEVDAIAFRVAADSLLPAATALLEGTMRLRRGLAADEANDFDVSSSAMLMDAWHRIQRILLIAGPALTGVALLVAVLVTTNVMLVVVTERIPEIGLRLAVGARPADILHQFLAESVVLAGGGGALGVLVGAAAVGLLRVSTSLPAGVGPGLALVGVSVSVLVGAAAGAYPAYRAARLTPIEALGRE